MLGLQSRSVFATRRLLLASGASVLTLALAAPAHAATVTISTGRTTPISTSTADTGGVPGDVAIVSGGSITLASGTAVTLDSDNSVTNSGTITIAQSNNAVGILVSGNRTGTISQLSVITLSPPTDTTITDYADGGAGIRIAAGSTLTGNISSTTATTINVTSDSSAGIDILGALNGDLNLGGTVNLAGTNSAGVNIAGPISGHAKIGAVSAVGVGSSAVSVKAPVGGRLELDSAINSTGFDKLVVDTTVGPTNYNATQAAKVGGPAVGIGASLGGGLLANGPDAVEIASVVAHTFSGTQTIRSSTIEYGPKPIFLISPTVATVPSDIHLGVVGAGDSAYGFVNRGAISSRGIYPGTSAEGVRIEGATISGTTYTTTLDGGFRNEYTIGVGASEASARGLIIGASANVPVFSNGELGSISVSSDGAAASTATAVLLEAGANMASIDNTGAITAQFQGPTGSAFAIRDLSGSLTSINNLGRIAATVSPAAGSTVAGGQTVAIDASGSGTGLTLTNDRPTTFNPGVSNPESFGRIVGNIQFGTGNDTFHQIQGNTTGTIDFGAGNDTFTIDSGSVLGSADFGAGSDVFTMTGGSFEGRLTDTDGALVISNTNATMGITNTGEIDVTNAAFHTGAIYMPTLDFGSGNSSLLKAGAGEIRFETGSKVALQFSHLVPADFTAPIAQASVLTIQPSLADLLTASVPFLYNVSLNRTSAAGIDSLNVHLALKTPADLGLPANWAPAFAPMLTALSHDDGLGVAILGLSTQADFQNAFSQLLPFNTDAMVETTRESSIDHSRMMRERSLDLLSGNRTGGVWGEELIHSFDRKGSVDSLAYNGQGLMTGFGIDDYVGSSTVLGLSFALDHGTFDESRVTGSPIGSSRYIAGLYGATGGGNLVLSASATGALTHNTSDRKVVIGGVTRKTSGKWDGSVFSGDVTGTYLGHLGALSIKPEGGFQFVRVGESAYKEAGGYDPANTAANAVALAVESRSDQSVMSHLGVGFSLGDETRHDESAAGYSPRLGIVPEFKVGWIHDFNSDPSQVRAHYVNETTSFTMKSDKRLQDLFSADLSIALVSDFGEVRLRLGGTFANGASAITGGISAGASF